MEMTLNSGQEAAATAVFQFLLGDDKEFILSGPAGVGKTFMMEYIMNNIMKNYENACGILGMPKKLHSVHLTATTNKAAEVLQNSTGYPTSTIHSFLGLKVTEDYKTGRNKIQKTGAWMVHRGIVLFIDEASMIDPQIHNYILEGTDKDSKIIYVGDHCQMAPVLEKISPIYKQPKHFVQLTQPVRNAGSPALMALCAQLRDTVETGKFRPIHESPGVIDYIGDTELKHILDTQFVNEDIDGRILCYTNARVQEYNEYIRGIRGYPETFTPGEIVVNNTGMELPNKTMLRVEQQFRVLEVVKTPYELPIDPTDENATLEVYDLRIRSNGGRDHVEAVVHVPTNFEHHSALCKYYASNKDWDRYWYLKKNFPDLRQKDAATVYKAQGSTYEMVVADLTNIGGKCHQPDQVARMLYVAASRPRSRLYLYGRLPAKYS